MGPASTSGFTPGLTVLNIALCSPECFFSRKITGDARLSQVLSRIMSSKVVQTKEVSTEIGKIYEGRAIEGFRLTIAVNDLGKGMGNFSIGQ